MERIKKSGGEVKTNDGGNGPMRVYKLNDGNPGLAVARSLGDCYGHECGVSEEPQVSYRILEDTDEFIVMGSDGIWDVMNSVEIVGYVFERTSDKVNRVDKEKLLCMAVYFPKKCLNNLIRSGVLNESLWINTGL